jgi:hypothetical protein
MATVNIEYLKSLPEVLELSLPYQAFAIEYVLNGGNATQAVAKTEYSGKNVTEQGSYLRNKPNIKKAINAIKQYISLTNSNEVSREWVLSRLRIEATEAKEASSRIRALELLGKTLNMFEEKSNQVFLFDNSSMKAVLDRAEEAKQAIASVTIEAEVEPSTGNKVAK